MPRQEWISRRTISFAHFIEGPPYPTVQLDRLCNCEIRPHDSWPRYNCDSVNPPHSLLYISKSIGNEVASIFWTENTFSVCRNEIGGLSVLKSIPKSRLATITSLVVRLNCCGSCCNCENPACRDWSHPICESAFCDPLQREDTDFELMLGKWRSFCQYLAPRITPKQLQLYVICDSADVATAEEIVKPLLLLPLLKECSIRLGRIEIGRAHV